MSTIEKAFKIEKLHKLIKSGFIGTSDEYAKNLNISRSCLFNYIEELKYIGADVVYSRELNKYIYLNNFNFEIKYEFSLTEIEEMKKIKGGMKKNPSVQIFRLKDFIFATE